MKERPILFSGAMVRALLAGEKTQTRRAIKFSRRTPLEYRGGGGRESPDWNNPACWGWENDSGREVALGAGPLVDRVVDCPYGQPGDRLYVRETFRIGEDLGDGWEPGMSQGDRFVIYDTAPGDENYIVPENYEVPSNAKEVHNSKGTNEHWRSFGPIPSIFMPRWASRILLEITGVRVERLNDCSDADCVAEGIGLNQSAVGVPLTNPTGETLPRSAYRELWESINGAGSWAANPFVWVVEFKRVMP